MLDRLRRNRLLQFVVLGGALFALEARRGEPRVVRIDPAVLAELRAAQAKKLGVERLSSEGGREVDARAIEDEILYREALRLGLDKEDPIVRQRLVQKLLLLVEDMGGASRDPTREEIRAHYTSTADRWRRPTKWHFVHVFARRREDLPAAELLAGATAAPPLGEPFPYPREMTLTHDAAARLFGVELADGLTTLAVGAVGDPLPSSFGWHRVRVLSREEGALASFEEVEKRVLLDLLLARRERVVGTYLVDTARAYDVRIGDAPLVGFVPTRRVAARTEGSAED
ncbi:MAG: peptidyl-prolyl cis-trans isomerase [Deltaproteobacteria bacterium]|nr:peptidyl-prolyl cis-trans isomerase [Deltaproteobacteria bacterium]